MQINLIDRRTIVSAEQSPSGSRRNTRRLQLDGIGSAEAEPNGLPSIVVSAILSVISLIN